jgi:hypothetical protein
MNTRSIAFSLAAAVGICFAASQLKANAPVQPEAVTQDVGGALASDHCGVERTDLEAWMICEGWMPYEEAIAVDEVIEQNVAEETEPQDTDTTLADASDEIVCADEAVESDGSSITEETANDELLESDEAVTEETEQVDVEAVQVFDAEVAETTEETLGETVTDKDVIQKFKCVEGFDGWIVERDCKAEGLTEEKDEPLESEAVVGEETVQVDADDAVQIFEEAATDESETTEEEIFANEELTDGSIWIAIFDADFDEGAFAADESTQEETIVEETVEATDDISSPVAVETLDEESFEQEAVEEVQDAIDAYEDLTTDGVVDNEETLEVVEPLIEEAELPETASESTAGDDVNESETGTVRTIELGGCKVTIQSDRQMDDFELLDMLWEAVDQLEAEMD